MPLSSVRITSPANNSTPAISGGAIDVVAQPDADCTLAVDYSTAPSPPGASFASLAPQPGHAASPTTFKVPAANGVPLSVVVWAYNDVNNGPIFSASVRVIPGAFIASGT